MEGKPMYFSRQLITSLKKSITLEKLIGQFIELEKHGDHFIGLCPFHDDHHPSFTVFPNTQTFYYFGCHAGSKQVTKSSDHIAFLMSFFKLSFPQAIVKLAEITNTPLPNQEKSPATTTEKSQQTQPQQPEIPDSKLPKVSKYPTCQEILNLPPNFITNQAETLLQKYIL